MRQLWIQMRTAILATAVLSVLVSVLHTTCLWLSGLAFPDQAGGSLLRRDGEVVGSRLIGQRFTAPRYFHPRPSAAGDGYDAASSGGTNLGPLNAKLVNDVRELAAEYRATNGLGDEVNVPVDAVTRSGSGLDPHISVANAMLQLPRVARARGMTDEAVGALVKASTESRDLGIFGEPRVNVLALNLALDRTAAGRRR